MDEKLLMDAEERRNQLIDAQFEADRAALAFQHAIRKLHAAGSSLREIAGALHLSHQRVHQIVDPESGKGALKEQKKSRRDARRSCSFCARPQAEVRKLIAGSGVYICDDCVDLALIVVSDRSALANDLTRIEHAETSWAACHFCGKKRDKVDDLVTALDVNICDECLGLCRRILTG